MANDLTSERLATTLGARQHQFFEAVGSTNDIAREWAAQGAPTGSLVLAELQTQGRGRFQRTWSAPIGTALLMSIILRPQLQPNQLSRITMLGAVAVAEAVNALAPRQVSLKWPNDVHLTGRKVAGILPEAEWSAGRCEYVVLGIGLNVRVDFTDTPMQETAASIEQVIGQTIDRAVLLNDLLIRIDRWSQRLYSDELWQAWRDRLSTLGQRVRARSATTHTNGEITGEAVDVDASGGLLIRDDNATIHHVVAGEVTLTM